MRKLRKYLIILTALSFYVGCSEVVFDSVPSEECEDIVNSGGNCIVTPEGFEFSNSFRVGKVDILFVDDNSGSMSVEQGKMADRFPDFISDISSLDYQLGIITTDISRSPGNGTPRAANGWGAFQDGRLLKFPDGSKILKTSSSNKVSQFQNTIQRQETITCDESGFKNCPSADERGIYALNMAMDRSENAGFFRTNAHLAVVILSDEDERSNGGNISGYELETYDLPETFVQKVNDQLGSLKTVSVHSVIIKPGDNQCFTAQNQQAGVKGFVGNLYAELSNPNNSLKQMGNILDGELGSICASDYGAQLGDIASKIMANTSPIVLPCQPDPSEFVVTFNPAPPQQITYDVDDNNLLTFDPQPPAGTTVTYSGNCPVGG